MGNTRTKIQKYYKNNNTWSSINKLLGYKNNTKIIKTRAVILNIDISHIGKKVNSYIWSCDDKTFCEYVRTSNTWTELLQKCGYNNVGNTKIVKKRIKELDLDITHLPKGQTWARSKKLKNKQQHSLEDILVKNSTYTNMVSLRKRLVKELNWIEECYVCKLSKWLDKPIPLEIDHINGIRNDNRIINLRFICCNCHALTSNYKGKNVRSRLPELESKKCIDCNCEIRRNSTRCNNCHNKYRFMKNENNRPSLEQLEKDIKEMPMVKVGKKYGVSDNTIRKWIKLYKKYK